MRINYSVIFFLNKRIEKNGKQKIYGRIYYKRRKSEFATNLWLEPEKWHHEMQTAIKSPVIMRKLNNIRAEIDQVVDRLKYEKKHIDSKSIADHYLGRNLFDIGVVAYVRRIKEQKMKQVNLSRETPVKYEQLAIKLEDYIRGRYRTTDVDIKRVDHSFITGFDNHLSSIVTRQFNKPLSKTTINKTHGFFRTVLNQAYDEGFIKIKPYSRFKLKKVDPVIRYLTKEELSRLENVDLSGHPELDRARDIFLFSVYTGLRFGDAQRLTTDHLKMINGTLFYSLDAQEKTQNPVENPVYPKALQIIKKYEDYAERQILKKLLPKMSNVKVNKNLKEIGEMAKIKQPVHHHMARHTCATTVLLENGVPLEMVKEFLGHADIKSTMVYAKITNTSKIREMERIKMLMNYH